MQVGELLRPITAAMGQELLKGDYIQEDETPVAVQMHDGRGKKHQAYLWHIAGRGQRLIRFLDYPVLELSNNLAESAIRHVALGRRNWIHIGSKDAGPRVAAIISVVETCRRLKISLRGYLGSVLPGLGDFPLGRIAELTPSAWANRN